MSSSSSQEAQIAALRKRIYTLQNTISNNYSLIAERDAVIEDLRARSSVIILISDAGITVSQNHALNSEDNFVYTFENGVDAQLTVKYADSEDTDCPYTIENNKLIIKATDLTDNVVIINGAVHQFYIVINVNGEIKVAELFGEGLSFNYDLGEGNFEVNGRVVASNKIHIDSIHANYKYDVKQFFKVFTGEDEEDVKAYVGKDLAFEIPEYDETLTYTISVRVGNGIVPFIHHDRFIYVPSKFITGDVQFTINGERDTFKSVKIVCEDTPVHLITGDQIDMGAVDYTATFSAGVIRGSFTAETENVKFSECVISYADNVWTLNAKVEGVVSGDVTITLHYMPAKEVDVTVNEEKVGTAFVGEAYSYTFSDFDFEMNTYRFKVTNGNAIVNNFDVAENRDIKQLTITIPNVEDAELAITFTVVPKIVIKVQINGAEPEIVARIDAKEQNYTYNISNYEPDKFHYKVTIADKEFVLSLPYIIIPVTGDETEILISIISIEYFTVKVINGELIVPESVKNIEIGESYEYEIPEYDAYNYKYVVSENAKIVDGKIVVENITEDVTVMLNIISLFRYTIIMDNEEQIVSEPFEAGQTATIKFVKDKSNHYQYTIEEIDTEYTEVANDEIEVIMIKNVTVKVTSRQYYLMSITIAGSVVEPAKAFVDAPFEYTIENPAPKKLYNAIIYVNGARFNDFTLKLFTLSIAEGLITADGSIEFTPIEAVQFRVIINGEEPIIDELIERGVGFTTEINGYEESKEYSIKVTVGEMVVSSGYSFIEDAEAKILILTIEKQIVLADLTVEITTTDKFMLMNENGDNLGWMPPTANFTLPLEKYGIEYNPKVYYIVTIMRGNYKLVQGNGHDGDYDFIIIDRDGDQSAEIEIFKEAITGSMIMSITETYKQHVFFIMNNKIVSEGYPEYIRGDEDYVLNCAEYVSVPEEYREFIQFESASVSSGNNVLGNDDFQFVTENGELRIYANNSHITGVVTISVTYSLYKFNCTVFETVNDQTVSNESQIEVYNPFEYYINTYNASEAAAWDIVLTIGGVVQETVEVIDGFVKVEHVTDDITLTIKYNTVNIDYAVYTNLTSPVFSRSGTKEALPRGIPYELKFETPETTPKTLFNYVTIIDGVMTKYDTTIVNKITLTEEQMRSNVQITIYNIMLPSEGSLLLVNKNGEVSHEEGEELTYSLADIDLTESHVLYDILVGDGEIVEEDGHLIIPDRSVSFLSVTGIVYETKPVFIADIDAYGVVYARVGKNFTYVIGSSQIPGSEAFDPNATYEITIDGNVPFTYENGVITVAAANIVDNMRITIRKKYAVTVTYGITIPINQLPAQYAFAYSNEKYILPIDINILGTQYNPNVDYFVTVKIANRTYNSDNQSSTTIQTSNIDGLQLLIYPNIITAPIAIDITPIYKLAISLYGAEPPAVRTFNPYKATNDFIYAIEPFYQAGGDEITETYTKVTITAPSTGKVLTAGTDYTVNEGGLLTIFRKVGNNYPVDNNYTISTTASFKYVYSFNGTIEDKNARVMAGIPKTQTIANYDPTHFNYQLYINNASKQLVEGTDYTINNGTILIKTSAINSDMTVVVIATPLLTLSDEEPVPEVYTVIDVFEFGAHTAQVFQNLYLKDYVYKLASKKISFDDLSIKVAAVDANGDVIDLTDKSLVDQKARTITLKKREIAEIALLLSTIRIVVSFKYDLTIDAISITSGGAIPDLSDKNFFTIDSGVNLKEYDIALTIGGAVIPVDDAVVTDGTNINIRKGYIRGRVVVELTKIVFAIEYTDIKTLSAIVPSDNVILNVGGITYNQTSKFTENAVEYDVDGTLTMTNLTQWLRDTYGYWIGVKLSEIANTTLKAAMYYEDEPTDLVDITDYTEPFVTEYSANRNLLLKCLYHSDAANSKDVTVNYHIAIAGNIIPCATVTVTQVMGTDQKDRDIDFNIAVSGRTFETSIKDYASEMHEYSEIKVYMSGKQVNVKCTLDKLTGKIVMQPIANITSDVRIFAYVSLYKYIVTFDSEGGSLVEAQRVLWNEIAEEPKDPVKNNYAFNGWWTTEAPVEGEEDDGEKWDFTTPIRENITLYARWLAGGLQVSLKGKGVVVNAYDPHAIKAGDKSFTLSFILAK